MNEGNDNLEYIINYFKKNNNKEQLEIYENMKKEYNLLYKLKPHINDETEKEVIGLEIEIINKKIQIEQNKIKQEEEEKEKIMNNNKISILKEKLQNYSSANEVLDNLIITSEELINKSEKLLNKGIDNTEELINQINENNTMIYKELETSNIIKNNDLEENINNIDLEIQNTIKKKINNLSEEIKKTTPVTTTENLYEDFKKEEN